MTLGTGFGSLEDIAHSLVDRLSDPHYTDLSVDVVHDRAHIFGISGSVEFASATSSTVEIGDAVYEVDAIDPTDARYRAAARHKRESGGPDVQYVEDIAAHARIQT